MKQQYSNQWILEKYENGENLKFLYFWGHTNKYDEAIGKFCFSQWYTSPFRVNDITYPTAEHWMMASKALLFSDKEIFEKIIKSETPKEAKDLGRQVAGYDEKIWNEHKYDIVRLGNIHKFSQHRDCADYLLKTDNKIIVEASPVDTIWGIGLSQDSKDIDNPHNWRGENLLGFALMETRDFLKNSGDISELQEAFQNKTTQLNSMSNPETTYLYRPVNQTELDLIQQSGWTKFPPRLPEQPIFYPVMNEEYAIQISREWNVPAYGVGHVTKFAVKTEYLQKFRIENVGGKIHNELWVPSEELEEFNSNIVGKIEHTHEFK